MKISDCVGKQIRVTTRNTIYLFDVFSPTDIHGEALANGREPRYLTSRTSDVEISGTKMVDYPLDSITTHSPKDWRMGEIVQGGYLRFRYPGQDEYVNTSRISDVSVVDLPGHSCPNGSCVPAS